MCMYNLHLVKVYICKNKRHNFFRFSNKKLVVMGFVTVLNAVLNFAGLDCQVDFAFSNHTHLFVHFIVQFTRIPIK